MRWVVRGVPRKDEDSIVVTVMIPTRGRVKKLIRAVKSLWATAYNANRIEILLRVDEDDTETLEMLKTTPLNVKALVGSRKRGYLSLHEHIHDMANAAQGRWLMAFNDDCVMLSERWDFALDVLIAQDQNEPFEKDGDKGVLWADDFWLIFPTIEGKENSHELFVVAKETYKILGRLAGNTGVDLWIDSVFTHLYRTATTPSIVISHVNDEDDKTFKEGRGNLNGRDEQYEINDGLESQLGRLDDARKLLKHIKTLHDDEKGRIECCRTKEGLLLEWNNIKGMMNVDWQDRAEKIAGTSDKDSSAMTLN